MIPYFPAADISAQGWPCGGNFNVCFDSESLQLVSAVKGNGSWMGALYEKAPGLVRVSFAQVEPLKEAVLCRLVFRVTADTSAEGSPVTLGSALLYNADSKLVDTKLEFGSVIRDCAWFVLENVDTVEGQGVRAQISLEGALQPCGGNFTLQYDPAVLKATDVIALDGMEHCQFTWNLEEAGIVRIAFAGEQPLENGALCAVVFQTHGATGSSSQLELTDVRAYDEDSKALDTAVSVGKIQIALPSEADPKLWVVGGAIDENGEATVSIVLQGRGKVCGGQCTLVFDDSMTIEEIQNGSGSVAYQVGGQLLVSWAREAPADQDVAETLVTVRFGNAVESLLTFDSNVRVYDANSKQIGVVDIRPGAITAAGQIHLMMDTVEVEKTEEASEVSVSFDVADATYFTEKPNEQIMPMLALYKDGQLLKIATTIIEKLDNGVAEVSLSASADASITDYVVFIAGDEISPLCDALRSK